METNFFCLGIQRQRLASKVQPWEAGFGPELDWEKLWRDRGQDDRDKWKQTSFFSRDSEAAFGTQSATMGGSFWMFGAKMTETNGNKLFFLGIQRQRLAPKVQPWEAGFGPELDWEKLWRDQVSGAKMTETNGNKLVFFLGIQRQRLAPKVRPWEARLGGSGPR